MTTFIMTQTVLGTTSSRLKRVCFSQFSNEAFVLKEMQNNGRSIIGTQRKGALLCETPGDKDDVKA